MPKAITGCPGDNHGVWFNGQIKFSRQKKKKGPLEKPVLMGSQWASLKG